MAIHTATDLKSNLGQHVSGFTGINQIVDIIDSIPSIASAAGSVSNTAATLLSANGTTQNTATTSVVSNLINIITSANLTSNSIIVNSSTLYQKIVNKSANTVLLFPFIGAQFDSYGFNNPVSLPTNNSVEIAITSPSQIYVVG